MASQWEILRKIWTLNVLEARWYERSGESQAQFIKALDTRHLPVT